MANELTNITNIIIKKNDIITSMTDEQLAQ
jgi:hypothetical protein